MKTQLFLVETLSTFRHRYLVEAPTQSLAEKAVTDAAVEEWQQKHLGEEVVKSFPVSRRELKSATYRTDNATDGSPWMPLEHFIHHVVPTDETP